MRLGTIGRTRIAMHWSVPLLFALLCIDGQLLPLLYALLALTLHECAHGVVAKNLSFAVASCTLYPFGAIMELEPLTPHPKGEGVVAAAGPIANLVAAASLLAPALYPPCKRVCEPFLWTNLCLCALNLLPAYPLDGGRVLAFLLLRTLRTQTVRRVLLALTSLSAVGFLAAGTVGVLKGYPLWTLLLLGAYLFVVGVGAIRRFGQAKVGAVLRRSAYLERGGSVAVRTRAISAQSTVGTAVRTLSGGAYTVLRVVEGERFLGELDEGVVLQAAARFGYAISIKDAFFSIDPHKKACYTVEGVICERVQ